MKRFLSLLCIGLISLVLISCGNDSKNPSDEQNNQQVTETNPLVEGIVFATKTFEYNGEKQYLVCENMPEGVTVKFGGNGKVEVGTYKVTAFFYDAEGNEIGRKYAELIILPKSSTDNGGNNGDDVPSTPTVDIDLSAVKFDGIEVDYDGQSHSIKCTNLPAGVSVRYEGNDVVEVGNHIVYAKIYDDKDNLLLTLEATIIIREVVLKYTACNQDGTEITSSNNIWNAIVHARDNSKSSNRCYVLRNSDSEKVYIFDSKTYYCYRSEEYDHSTTSESEAISWGKKYPDCYVLNGKATEFIYVGKTIETQYGLDKDSVYGTELFSGSYGYLYGKDGGNISGGAYTYVQFKVELSKAKLKYFTDDCNEIGWNAYVFCNMTMSSPWVSCDMGITNISSGTPGGFAPIFNYHSANNSSVGMYNPGPNAGNVSQMEYNEETGYWENGDDLLITCWVWDKYFVMNIKNLNPNSECFNRDKTDPLYGTHEWEYTCEITESGFRPNSSKLLLAASNCPVQKAGAFWNPRCGNAFENVIFRDMKVAHWGSHTKTEDYGYDHKDFHYILTVGADNCKITHGTDEQGAFFNISMSNYSR